MRGEAAGSRRRTLLGAMGLPRWCRTFAGLNFRVFEAVIVDRAAWSDVPVLDSHQRPSISNAKALQPRSMPILDLSKIGATLVPLFLASIQVAPAGDLRGQASIIDGDTLEIHGTRIRLWCIDAPESNQLCRGDDSLPYRCGAKPANDLDAFIAGRPVNCLPISLDRYGRTVATCLVGGADLGDWLVRNGLALDWPQYSK
jgi:endonuclease YncB( thermonuclease family)